VVTVLFFASLREALGTGRESVALPSGNATVSMLVEALRSRDGSWSEALSPSRRWRVAVNQEMADLQTPVKPGDEIAFFPPVTGG
jgi:molybdopterin synthase sulfur carrier subunit